MADFYLKYRDTRPILEVVLLNPDGSVHDLTGSTSHKLHIWLNTGEKLERSLAIEGAPTAGTLRYTWQATDWTDTVKLLVGVHRMEYEVYVGTARESFPNAGYDFIHIIPDIGQGA